MRTITCILHGITDKPLQDLGGLTPLQKASCENLDFLAKEGSFFSATPPRCGGVEAALMSLLSKYDVSEPLALGLLQAYSCGYDVNVDQMAFVIRLISTVNDIVVDVSDDIVSDEEGRMLCKGLNDAASELGCHFLHISGPNAVVIMQSSCEYNHTGFHEYNPIKTEGKHWLYPLALSKHPSNLELASLLRKASEILGNHEINALREDLEEPQVNALLISHVGGMFHDIQKYTPEDASDTLLYTTSPVSSGISKLLGIDLLKLPSEHKKYSHLQTILCRLDTILEKKDRIIMEFHYLWNSTFKGDLLGKVKGIEFLDKNLMGPLVKYCSSHDVQLTVLPLQNSDIKSGEWRSGNIPVAIFPSSMERKPLQAFQVSAFQEQYVAGAKNIPLHTLA